LELQDKATEQRDEYKAALQSADNHNHEIATKLEIVTEQRDEMTLRWELTNDSLFDKRALADRLAEELTTTQQAHDVVVLAFRKVDAELTAAREEIDMMGIRYAAAEMHHANNMHEVTEQRDRLEEALANIARQNLSEEMDDHSCERADWQGGYESIVKIAREAIQSLNQPERTI
jgi:chromosome segregation ATPase